MNPMNSSGRTIARSVALVVLASALATGCGSKDEQAASTAPPAAAPAPAPAAPPVSAEQQEKDARMANAVVDGKATAPVDLHYDLLSKPAPGQPFEVEMSLRPRVDADALDVQVAESTGLTIAGERTARFAAVESGKDYSLKVLVQGAAPGIYYIGVTASISSKVQTETRAFSIPVVIGTPAAQKAAPQTDSTGQAIQSMPAKEN